MARPKTGGRLAGTPNKATKEIKELARVHGPAMIRRLAWLAKKADSHAAQVSAIKEMLDRGYGKAPQALKHSGAIGTYDLTNASDDELIALAAVLDRLAQSGAGEGGDSEESGGEAET